MSHGFLNIKESEVTCSSSNNKNKCQKIADNSTLISISLFYPEILGEVITNPGNFELCYRNSGLQM